LCLGVLGVGLRTCGAFMYKFLYIIIELEEKRIENI
jgi:hypothetical protein